MNFGNVSDFSAKDSKEYNDSVKLFEAAGNATSEVLEEFKDTLYYQEAIPTHLKAKTHNSSHFLDEDYLSKKKMNANTSALKELTEELMFGSTEEDLDAEVVDGGVATEIAGVLAQHGITGKAVKDTFDKVQNFFGKDPDTSELAGGFEDATDDEDSEIEDEDTSDEIDPDEVVADMEDDSDSDEEPVEESRKSNLNKQFLEARRMLKRNIAIKNLKKSFKENAKKTSKRNLKEALLVAPTGEFKAPMSQGRLLAGLREKRGDFDDRTEYEVIGGYSIDINGEKRPYIPEVEELVDAVKDHIPDTVIYALPNDYQVYVACRASDRLPDEKSAGKLLKAAICEADVDDIYEISCREPDEAALENYFIPNGYDPEVDDLAVLTFDWNEFGAGYEDEMEDALMYDDYEDEDYDDEDYDE